MSARGQSRAIAGGVLALLTVAFASSAGHSAHAADAIASGTAEPLPRWFTDLPRGDPVRSLDGEHVARKLRLNSFGNRYTRNAIAATLDPLSLSATVDTDDWLEVGMAAPCSPPAAKCTGTSTFRIVAEGPDGLSQSLMTEQLDAASGWHHRRIELRELAGKQVRLLFSARPDPAPRSAATARPFPVWGEPLLRKPTQDRGVNIVLVSIDTLRADHLGCYGYERDTSPALDALARQGVRFDQAISQAPWTTPSHMSIFTSMLPSSHHVNESFRKPDTPGDSPGYRRLADDIATLAETLQKSGFSTVALTGGATMSSEIGFDKGFDEYREYHGRPPEQWEHIRSRLSELRREPFFLFLHTFEVHAPYFHTRYVKPLITEAQLKEINALRLDDELRKRAVQVAATTRKEHDAPVLVRRGLTDLRDYLARSGLMRAEITSALYDGGIRFVDELLIAGLVRELEQLKLDDRTLLVVTSDHGDEFGEHDPSRIYDAHCTTLYDSLLRVPLILRLPGRFAAGTKVDDQVRLIDIAPTILDLLDLDTPTGMQGRSLLPLMEGRETPAEWAVSEATCAGPEWKSIRSRDRKYIIANAAAGAWWEVDLGEVVGIDTIRIWNRTDCYGERLARYSVLVSYHPNPSKDENNVFSHFETKQAGSPTEIAVGRPGRFVRIERVGDGLLAIAEVEVMRRHDGKLTNVAHGKAATQSSTTFSGDAARAVDGNTDGNFSLGSVTHTEWQVPVVERSGIRGYPEVPLLFDVANDPNEQRSIYSTERETALRLERILREHLSGSAANNHATPAVRELSEDTLERLRALGYIK